MLTHVMPSMFHALRSKQGSVRQMLLLAAALFAAALMVLMAQPAHGLPVLWLADALLAGLLLRHPEWVRPMVWPTALAALVLAGLIAGETLLQTLGHGLTHVTGAYVAWRLLAHTRALDRLRRPRAILYILGACAMAAAVQTACAAMLTPWFHPDAAWSSLLTEGFLNPWLSYCTVLPPLLLEPRPGRRQRRTDSLPTLETLAPFVALLIGLALCFIVGGPSILVFPIPPLLYSALIHRQQTTAWLVLLAAAVISFSTAHDLIPLGPLLHQDLASLQLGMLLLVTTPLIMSSVLAARSDTISALNLALDHDVLTGALSRQAFMRRIQTRVHDPATPRGTGLLMLDLDHFKGLNDACGHAAGDLTLRAFAHTIQSALRPDDLFGRLGGEEFGIGLSNTTPDEVAVIAERLRACVADQVADHVEGFALPPVTVSIGAIHDAQMPDATLQSLLSYADRAMYQAKRSGRNRVCFHESVPDTPSTRTEACNAQAPYPAGDVARSHSTY